MRSTNQNDPATFPTPRGFRRLSKLEALKKGDLFLHLSTLKWIPVSTVPIKENYYTNCIRPYTGPIALLTERCS